jgi:probable HAF family extracellular repeat protein
LSEATDINDGGQIVGWSDTTSGQQRHAVLWNNGVVVDLGTLGGTTSEANAINKRGEVVGHSTKAQGFASYAWLWYRGEMIELGSLGGVSSYAVGINDQRQVVGQGLLPNGDSHAVLWTITPTHYTVYLPQLVQ